MRSRWARPRGLLAAVPFLTAGVLAASSTTHALPSGSLPGVPAPADAAVPVTTDPADQVRPAISWERVVWQDARNCSWDVYMLDLATGVESALATGSAEQIMPAIGGETVAWHEYAPGGSGRVPSEIVVLDLATGSRTRLDGGLLDFAEMNNRDNTAVTVSDDWVVWPHRGPLPLNPRLGPTVSIRA